MYKSVTVLIAFLLTGCSSIDPHQPPDRVLVPSEAGMAPIRYAIPEYPEQAQQQRIEGWALVEFTVSEDGRPEGIQIVDSEPGTVFDESAVNAATHLVYVPRVKNGQLVAVSGVQYRYIFDLMESQGEETEVSEPVK